MRDGRRGCDLAVGKVEPGGAEDLLLVPGFGVAFAFCGLRDAPSNVCAEVIADALSPGALGIGDRS